MSTSSSGRKTPVDYGVQIRFINDFRDSGGGQPGAQPRTKTQNASKYGVAVRVQGIAGQPYVVLKDGYKGDSYGVQLRTQYPAGYSSLPRRTEKTESGTQGADVTGGAGQGGPLRRAQSHGSLLDREREEGAGSGGEEFQLRRPPGDGRSGSYGNLDGGIGIRGAGEQAHHVGVREGVNERCIWDDSYHTGLNETVGTARAGQSSQHPPQHTDGLHSTSRQPPVNRPMNRFDGGNPGAQQRGYSPAQQDPRDASPLLAPNPYSSPPSSTHIVRSQDAVANVAAHSANQWPSPGRRVTVETPAANQNEAQVSIQFLAVHTC